MSIRGQIFDFWLVLTFWTTLALYHADYSEKLDNPEIFCSNISTSCPGQPRNKKKIWTTTNFQISGLCSGTKIMMQTKTHILRDLTKILSSYLISATHKIEYVYSNSTKKFNLYEDIFIIFSRIRKVDFF